LKSRANCNKFLFSFTRAAQLLHNIVMPNSPAELDSIERFIVAYNAIDAHLQNVFGNDAPSSFRSLVDAYAKKHRWWKDAEILRTAAGLRNLLIHEKVAAYEYPCVPTEILVLNLENIRERFLHPQLAIPKFAREVVTIKTEDSLAKVLKLIHALQITHFPVYDDAEKFAGVLTENGITRWLAEHISNEASLVEMNDEPIREVLAREEKRRNYEFAPSGAKVEELSHRFHENAYLEAVLITRTGKVEEKLLGIITRWDVLRAQ